MKSARPTPCTTPTTPSRWRAAPASTIVKQGGKTWYFLTADYAFGQSLEKDTTDVIKANGGTVLGSVKHPLAASDFSSFLLQAQASKAQMLGLANAGGDTINADQGRQRVRHHQEHEAGRPAGVHQRHPHRWA